PALFQTIGLHMTGNGPNIIADSAINVNDGTGVGGFKGQVFSSPPSGQAGSLQPRMFTGPSVYNLDLGIHKMFRITERQSLEFRGDARNVLNHPGYFIGDQNINSAFFGTNIGTLGQRAVQLALYYRF